VSKGGCAQLNLVLLALY